MVIRFLNLQYHILYSDFYEEQQQLLHWGFRAYIVNILCLKVSDLQTIHVVHQVNRLQEALQNPICTCKILVCEHIRFFLLERLLSKKSVCLSPVNVVEEMINNNNKLTIFICEFLLMAGNNLIYSMTVSNYMHTFLFRLQTYIIRIICC